jgi:hypothetical protein
MSRGLATAICAKLLYLPGTMSARVFDKVVAIDGLESQQFVLLQLLIFNLGRSVGARGMEAREAGVVTLAAGVDGRLPSSRCFRRHSTYGVEVSQL